MKIGITCYPTIGGSGALATELGIWLAERGHQIHFITSDMPFRLRERYTENVCYHRVTLENYHLFKYPPYSLALAVKMAEVVKWHQLDILHVHYAIPHAVSAFLAREMLGGSLKIITTLHGTDVTLIGQDPSYTEIIRMALQKSDVVTAVSHSLKEDSSKTFNIEKDIQVIHNFIDPRRYHPDVKCNHFHPEAKGKEKIIVHVSNFRQVKKVDDLIHVFNKVVKRMPARLFLIGDGESMPQVRQLCREYEICDKVEFLGEQESVACILPRCDLFLMTSRLESFGLAALEAMACGVPVVAYRIGGLPEVIEDGVQGRLIEAGDIDKMAEAVVEVLDEKDHERYSQASVEHSRENFHIDAIGAKYEKLYCENKA